MLYKVDELRGLPKRNNYNKTSTTVGVERFVIIRVRMFMTITTLKNARKYDRKISKYPIKK